MARWLGLSPGKLTYISKCKMLITNVCTFPAFEWHTIAHYHDVRIINVFFHPISPASQQRDGGRGPGIGRKANLAVTNMIKNQERISSI